MNIKQIPNTVLNYSTYIKHLLKIEIESLESKKNKNTCILGDKSRPLLHDEVNIHYWRGEKENLGDYLSTIICEYYREQHNLPIKLKNYNKAKNLYAVGSILGFCCEDTVVWGSGVLHPYRIYQRNTARSNLDIRCVRGPLTRDFLIKSKKKCPEIYGDPALLMPLIYPVPSTPKKYDVTLIRHFQDNNQPTKNHLVHTLDISTTNYQTFISEINVSKIVISSSLHGIILAEAYGIPAIWLRCGQSEYKYRDYYYSTERFNPIIASSIEDALTLTPMPIPRLDNLQKNLINTFPVDLWTN